MRITRPGYPRPPQERQPSWLLRTSCNICLVAMLGIAMGVDQNGWW